MHGRARRGRGEMVHQDDDNKIKCMPRTGSRTTKYITRCPELGWRRERMRMEATRTQKQPAKQPA